MKRPNVSLACVPLQARRGGQSEGGPLYYEKESGALNFVAGLAIGAVLGASIALLTAPQSGKRTRRRVVRAIADARDTAGEEWQNASGRVKRAVRRRRRIQR